MEIDTFQEDQIAPCGANCLICMGYMKSAKSCPGCRKGNINKPNSCISCRIMNCNILIEKNLVYCYECEQFPCRKIKHLDDRYQKNYNFSMVENLINISNKGIKIFLLNERVKWICSDCDGIISVHRGYCSKCGKIYYNHSGTKRAPIK